MEILDQKELSTIARVTHQAKLIDWLHKNGIKYKYTHDKKVFTTLKQLNNSFERKKIASHEIKFGE